jgi:hypothetical protein
MYKNIDFSVLKGKTLVSVEGCRTGSDCVTFRTTDGKSYSLFHSQNCCESVSINDIDGDFNDLIGEPLLVAEENSSLDGFVDTVKHYDSYTWTFYRLATQKGWVVIRWLGESNGCYSESVDFVENTIWP